MKKYVSYYRVSTAEQGKSGLGLEAQRKYIESFISGAKAQIIGEYTDIESGSKINRLGLRNAIHACKMSGATLLVGKLDRLSRGGFKIIVELEDAGVNYIDATSPGDTEFIKEVKLSLAKDERKKISERTKAALQALKARGVKLGNPENLTDKARELAIEANRLKAATNENNRRAMALISSLKLNGLTLEDIAKRLNEFGYKTATGKEFLPMTVKRLHDRSLHI